MPTWCPFRLQFYCNDDDDLGESHAEDGDRRVMGAIENLTGDGWEYFPPHETWRRFTRFFVQTLSDGEWRNTPPKGEALAAAELPDPALERAKAL